MSELSRRATVLSILCAIFSGCLLIAISASPAKAQVFQRVPKFSGARVFNPSSQNIPRSSKTVLKFPSEVYDTDNYHYPTNPGRIDIPFNGKYLVTANFGYNEPPDPGPNEDRRLFIRLNGITNIADTRVQPTFGNTTMCVSTVHEFVQGDYLEVLTFYRNLQPPMSISSGEEAGGPLGNVFHFTISRLGR